MKFEKKFCDVRLDRCLWSSDVSENLPIRTELHEDGADERRNALEY